MPAQYINLTQFRDQRWEYAGLTRQNDASFVSFVIGWANSKKMDHSDLACTIRPIWTSLVPYVAFSRFGIGERMRQKDRGDAGSIVEFPRSRMNGAKPLDRKDASKAVSSLVEQLRDCAWNEPLNVKAIVASLRLAQVWLKQDADLACKLSEAYEAMEEVVQSNVDTAWLFERDGEPRMDLISPEVFEVLIELRVFADRLQRIGVVN